MTYNGKPRGTPKGTLKAAPMFPEKAREILRLIEQGVPKQDIAARFHMTGAGVTHYASRWKDYK